MNVVNRLLVRGGGLAFQTGAYSISNTAQSRSLLFTHTRLHAHAHGCRIRPTRLAPFYCPGPASDRQIWSARRIGAVPSRTRDQTTFRCVALDLDGIGARARRRNSTGSPAATAPPSPISINRDRGRTGQLLALVGALTAAHAWFVLMSSYYRARRLPAPFLLVSVIVAGLLLFGTVGGLTFIEVSVEMVLIVHALAYGPSCSGR